MNHVNKVIHTSAGIFILFVFSDCRFEQSRPGFRKSFQIASHLVLANMNSSHHIRWQSDLVYRLVLFILIFSTKNSVLQRLHVFRFLTINLNTILTNFYAILWPCWHKTKIKETRNCWRPGRWLKCEIKIKGSVELVWLMWTYVEVMVREILIECK